MSSILSGADFHNTVTAMSIRLHIPDLSTKSNLLNFLRGDNFEDGIRRIAACCKDSESDHDAMAALAVLCSRLCVGEACKIKMTEQFLGSDMLVLFIYWGRPTCTVLAGLQLICTMLSAPFEELLPEILTELSRTLTNILIMTRTDGLVLDLGFQILDLITRQVLLSHSEHKVRRCALDQIHSVSLLRSASALKHIMRNVHLVTSRQDARGEHDPFIVHFYLGLFRTGYPRARRFALRCLSIVSWDDASGTHWDPTQFAQSARTILLSRAVQAHAHGREACDSVRLARCLTAFYDAFRGFTVTRDVRSLGLRLYALISEDPDSLCFEQPFARRTGVSSRTPRYYDIDCESWPDILVVCAAAVRRLARPALLALIPEQLLGEATAEDVADVLLLHHTTFTGDDGLSRHRLYEAMLRRETRERYFYYLMTMYRSARLDITAASFQYIRQLYAPMTFIFQRGLACYVQHLYTATVMEGTSVHGDEDEWEWVTQRVCEIGDLCDEYLDVAPPDARDRTIVLEIAIVTQLLIQGPRETANLDNIKDKIADWGATVAITKSLWCGARRDLTAVNKGLVEIMLKYYALAARRWDEPIRRIVAPNGAEDNFDDDFDPPVERVFTARDLHGWRERVFAPLPQDMSVDWTAVPRKVLEAFVHPSPGLRPQTMRKCAACGIATVFLRRCSRCRAVRYCARKCRTIG